MPRADAADALISTVLRLPEKAFEPKQSHRAMGALVAELEASPRADTKSSARGRPSRHLTLRLSCGARAPQRLRHRPPARRQLQPVVSRLAAIPALATPSAVAATSCQQPRRLLAPKTVLVVPNTKKQDSRCVIVGKYCQHMQRREHTRQSTIRQLPRVMRRVERREAGYQNSPAATACSSRSQASWPGLEGATNTARTVVAL